MKTADSSDSPTRSSFAKMRLKPISNFADGRVVPNLDVFTVEVLGEARVLAVKAVLLQRQCVVHIVLSRAGEISVLADSDFGGKQSIPRVQINLLIGVVEIAGVVVTGEADTVAEVVVFPAVAEVSIDFKAVTDVGRPGAGVETSAARSRDRRWPRTRTGRYRDSSSRSPSRYSPRSSACAIPTRSKHHCDEVLP